MANFAASWGGGGGSGSGGGGGLPVGPSRRYDSGPSEEQDDAGIASFDWSDPAGSVGAAAGNIGQSVSNIAGGALGVIGSVGIPGVGNVGQIPEAGGNLLGAIGQIGIPNTSYGTAVDTGGVLGGGGAMNVGSLPGAAMDVLGFSGRQLETFAARERLTAAKEGRLSYVDGLLNAMPLSMMPRLLSGETVKSMESGGNIPPDLLMRLDAGESVDDIANEMVARGAGFSNEAGINITASIVYDPMNLISAGSTGLLRGAQKAGVAVNLAAEGGEAAHGVTSLIGKTYNVATHGLTRGQQAFVEKVVGPATAGVAHAYGPQKVVNLVKRTTNMAPDFGERLNQALAVAHRHFVLSTAARAVSDDAAKNMLDAERFASPDDVARLLDTRVGQADPAALTRMTEDDARRFAPTFDGMTPEEVRAQTISKLAVIIGATDDDALRILGKTADDLQTQQLVHLAYWGRIADETAKGKRAVDLTALRSTLNGGGDESIRAGQEAASQAENVAVGVARGGTAESGGAVRAAEPAAAPAAETAAAPAAAAPEPPHPYNISAQPKFGSPGYQYVVSSKGATGNIHVATSRETFATADEAVKAGDEYATRLAAKLRQDLGMEPVPTTEAATAAPDPASAAPELASRDAYYSGGNLDLRDKGSIAKFDALGDDDSVWVFHGTSPQTAAAIERDGLQMSNLPQNLARQRYAAGEEATFAPGAGVGQGTYVTGTAYGAEGYGREIVALRVRKGDLAVPPEGDGMTLGEALFRGETGGIITKDIPASAVVRLRNTGRVPGDSYDELTAAIGGRPTAAAPEPGSAAALPEPWRNDPYADKTELVSLDEISAIQPGNRLGKTDVDELAADIKANGFREPIVIEYSKADKTAKIGEGNHRIEAARRLGLTEVPVRVVRRDGPIGGSPVSGMAADAHGYVPADLKPSQIGVGKPAAPEPGSAAALDPLFDPNVPAEQAIFRTAPAAAETAGFGKALTAEDIERLTPIAPDTLTMGRAAALDQLKGDAFRREALRYYDFRSLAGDAWDEQKARELLERMRDGDYLPRTLAEARPPSDNAIPSLLGDIRAEMNRFGYEMGFGPKEGWRVLTDADGNVLTQSPFVRVSSDATPLTVRNQFGRYMDNLFRGVNQTRIIIESRQRLSQRLAPLGVNASETERIHRQILWRARDQRVAPRGLALGFGKPANLALPEGGTANVSLNPFDEAFRDVIGDQRFVELVREHDPTTLVMQAFEGNLSTVGVTQKVSGKAKSVPKIGRGIAAIAEGIYPLTKFRYNPLFQTQEVFESPFFNSLRGAGAVDPDLEKLYSAMGELDEFHWLAGAEYTLNTAGGNAVKRAFGKTASGKIAAAIPDVQAVKKHAQFAQIITEHPEDFKATINAVNPRLWKIMEEAYGTTDPSAITAAFMRERMGLASGSLADTLRVFDEAADAARAGAKESDFAMETVWNAFRESARRRSEQAFKTHYFSANRSFMERTINHPYLGLYPASYMWGKVLPEFGRFLLKRPFGMDAPLVGLAALKKAQEAYVAELATNPEFAEWVKENKDAIYLANLLLPSLPTDIAARTPSWYRRVGRTAAAGNIESPQDAAETTMRAANDAFAYALGPTSSGNTILGAGIDIAENLAAVPGEIEKALANAARMYDGMFGSQ